MAIANRGIVLRPIDRLFRDGSLVGLADSQLLDRYLTRRDEAAFEALLDIHGPMVLALCRRILRDPLDVEDAFQATFLVLVRKAPAIRDRALLSSWLYGVAFRVATRARTNALRRRGREMTVANPDAAVDADAPDLLGIGPALDQELNRLPGKFRAPLVLCYLRGQTHDQAAAELRCPVGTVRSRLARGRDMLKRRLTSRGLAPTAAVFPTGVSLPDQLVNQPVPPRLLASTIEAAFSSSMFTTMQAGAVSSAALALSQGVLSSMRFAYVKWIGLAVLTTSFSVGGVVAITHARSQSAPVGGEQVLSPTRVVNPQESSIAQSKANVGATSESDSTVDREQEIERKIDQLLQDIGFFGSDGSDGRPASDGSVAARVLKRRLGELLGFQNATTSTTVATSGRSASASGTPANTAASSGTASTSRSTTPTAKTPSSAASRSLSARRADRNVDAIDPFRPDPAVTKPDLDPRTPVETARQSISALGVELKLAVETFGWIERLYKAQSISHQQWEEARGKVLLTAAVLEGLYDELEEQNDRLKLEFKKKRAELGQAQAQREVAASVVAHNLRLAQSNIVPADSTERVKAHGELKGAEALVQIKQVELEELELRREQLLKRAARIKQVLPLAERARAAAGQPTLPPGGASETP
jgi:RNA polymerase sigma factor (sigma-70 family)